MTCDEARLYLPAYLDDELDVGGFDTGDPFNAALGISLQDRPHPAARSGECEFDIYFKAAVRQQLHIIVIN